jgi:hypothetical protein
LISAVLGPLGPRITIYIGTSHRRSNESSLKYNTFTVTNMGLQLEHMLHITSAVPETRTFKSS